MRIIRKFIKWMFILFFGSSILAVAIYRYVPVYVTPLMIIRAIDPSGDKQEKFRQRHWQHQWISYDEISSYMPCAVVASEDAHFYEHNGFDLKQIDKAIKENKKSGRQRGASTISQQTAKNVFLWPAHSWIRKGLETYFTVLIEFMWSKERIMEVYLNSIEMGPGIYGVSAAAHHYYDTEAANLSKHQCAMIAISLPAPLKRNPSYPSKYMRKRQRQILRYMDC